MSLELSADRSNRSWLTALLGFVALASARRFGNGTAWDDDMLLDLAQRLVARGQWLQAFLHSTLGQVVERSGNAAGAALDLYRPLSLLSFALDYVIGGRAPFIYHFTNLALHLGCTALVWFLARALLPSERRGFALLAAAWFGVSPHLAEAHVWISGRFDEVSTLFALLSVLCFVHGERALEPGRRRLLAAAAGVACLCSLLGKEAFAFALPALAFVPGVSARDLRGKARQLAPFLLAVLAYAALRLHALHGAGGGVEDSNEGGRALAYWPLLFWDSVTSLLLPINVYSRSLHDDYTALPAWLSALAAVGCVLAGILAVRGRERAPVFAWSLVWLACSVVPIALIATRAWPGFGRFLYLPASVFFIGMADLVGLAYVRLPRYAPLLRALLPVHVVILAFALHVYTADFESDDTLFGSVIEHAPDHAHGYAFLGISYLERHRYEEAAVLLRKANALAPGTRRYMQPLGQALLFSGHDEEALALARAGVTTFRRAPEFHLLAAYALLRRAPPLAAGEVLACLRQDLQNPECRDALSFLVTKHPEAQQFRAQLGSLIEAMTSPSDAQLRRYVRSVL